MIYLFFLESPMFYMYYLKISIGRSSHYWLLCRLKYLWSFTRDMEKYRNSESFTARLTFLKTEVTFFPQLRFVWNEPWSRFCKTFSPFGSSCDSSEDFSCFLLFLLVPKILAVTQSKTTVTISHTFSFFFSQAAKLYWGWLFLSFFFFTLSLIFHTPVSQFRAAN